MIDQLRHDEIRLEVLPVKRRRIQVRKHQPIRRIGQNLDIPRLVMPSLKVRGLRRPDTEQNPQNLHVGHPLSQRWVEAGSTLLNEGKVKPRRIVNRLDMRMWGQVRIRPWNRRELPRSKSRNRLRKCKARVQIGIILATAIPRPPA